MDAFYVKSDNIRFLSTYQNISSVEQRYFSISKNDDTVWLSSIVWKLCPTLWSSTTIWIYRKVSLKITSIMKKNCKWITTFLTNFYVWNTACNADFYKIPLPFIIIFSQKNALFRNILLLRVHYISILYLQYSFAYLREYTKSEIFSNCKKSPTKVMYFCLHLLCYLSIFQEKYVSFTIITENWNFGIINYIIFNNYISKSHFPFLLFCTITVYI